MIKQVLLGIIAILVLVAFFLYTPDKSIETLKAKYTNAQSQFVTVQGMNVHYKIEGEGMPLLLLHGTGSSLHTWDEWTHLMSSSFKVVRLDLPAYGLTGPHPAGKYELTDYIEFLDEFAEEIEIDSFHVAGNSFGGALSFIYAGHYPEKVGKLILMDAAGLPSDAEPPFVFKLASNPISSMILKKVTPKSFMKKNLLEVFYNDDLVTNEKIERYHDMAIREGNRQAFVDIVNTPRQDHSGLLSKLEEPTLIMWGEADEWTAFENAGKMDKMVPNSRMVTYPNVGHLPMEEIPAQSAKDALSFLMED